MKKYLDHDPMKEVDKLLEWAERGDVDQHVSAPLLVIKTALEDLAVQQVRIERLQDALKRIERIAPLYIADIATEALRNTKGEN